MYIQRHGSMEQYNSLIASEKKLFFSPVVQAWMLCNLLPEGRGKGGEWSMCWCVDPCMMQACSASADGNVRDQW